MRQRSICIWGCLLAFAIALTGCAKERQAPFDGMERNATVQTGDASAAATPLPSEAVDAEKDTEDLGSRKEDLAMKMNVQVGDSVFTATLERNSAVDALVDMMQQAPVTIRMSDYAGFEKVGSLGTSLPASNRQTTTQSGDIVLYQGNQIVIFYGSNAWSYTRLAKIDDLAGWEEALGSGDVTVTLSLAN
nr:cyclophilin-like fold protein [uncultured Agathobaculum sp.]